MNDIYMYIIVVLLPLTSLMVVLQVNPYQALVMRGILGAVAALVYTVLGAADVALTEALVGTMLAITLYAVAVRSSMVLRLGILKDELDERRIDQLVDIATSDHQGALVDGANKLMYQAAITDDATSSTAKSSTVASQLTELMADLRSIFGKYHMRLELIAYPSHQALHQALLTKEIHATCARRALDVQTQPNNSVQPKNSAQPSSSVQPNNSVQPNSLASQYQAQPYYTATRLRRLYQIMQAELTFSETTLNYIDVNSGSVLSNLVPGRPASRSLASDSEFVSKSSRKSTGESNDELDGESISSN